MSSNRFHISSQLMQSLQDNGNWDVFLESQLIIHEFDLEKPYSLREDPATHQVVITQEIEDEKAVGPTDDSL